MKEEEERYDELFWARQRELLKEKDTFVSFEGRAEIRRRNKEIAQELTKT